MTDSGQDLAWETRSEAVFTVTVLAGGKVVATMGASFDTGHAKMFRASVEAIYDLAHRT